MSAHLKPRISHRSILLMVPGAVIVSGVAVVLSSMHTRAPYAIPAALVYLALAAGLLLAWRFRSARAFAAGVLLASAFALLRMPALAHDRLAQTLAATCLPLGIALLTLVRDRGFTIARIRDRLLLGLAPLAIAAFLAAGDPTRATDWLTGNLIDPIYSDWGALPQLALLVLAVALAVGLARTLLTGRAVEAGLTWLTLTTACALALPATSDQRTAWMLAGAAVLIAAVIEAAYMMAFYDELTELPGRRALAHALHALEAPYAIAIVDVDHFKSFNDRYGHDVGDQVLRMVAARLRRVRGGGTAYRSGGEEFTLVFPRLNKGDALAHVEQVRAAVAGASFAIRRLPRPRGKKAQQQRGKARKPASAVQVTISVGLAGPTARHNSVEAVVKLADQAMYRAKNAGRNRVMA